MNRGIFAAVALALNLSSMSAHAFIWPSVPEELERSLSVDDIDERRAAAARLRELPPGSAEPLILRALGDGDVEVRLAAGRAAAQLQIAGAGAKVLDWLSETDPRLRLLACEVLRVAPSARAVTPLSRVLGDANADVRKAAATTLGMTSSAEAVGALLGHLDDPSPEVRTAVVLALGRIGDQRAVVPLLGKVQDTNAEMRRMTVRVLGDLADPRASSALLLALRDRVPEVRVEAVESLGRLGSSEATTALQPLVMDASAPRVRDAAVSALGRIGTPAAIEVLVAAFDTDDASSETSTVRDVLAAQGKRAEPQLRAVLRNASSPAALAGACLVLGELGGRDNTELIVAAMQRGQVAQTVGLRALQKSGQASALPHVLELLDAPSVAVRRSAIDAAHALLDPPVQDGRAVDPIVARLAQPRLGLNERLELVELLGRTGSPRAAPMLIALAKSVELRLRIAALEALGRVAPAGQNAVLLDALGDDEPSARLAAAIAASKVGDETMARELLRRLALASEQDRGALGIALSGALSRASDAALAQSVEQMMEIVPEPSRDVLIEGLGRMKTAAATPVLARVGQSVSADDRRKVAEALGGRPEALELLRKLVQDPDPSVQANAVWAIGQVGDGKDVGVLEGLLGHRDVAVAGNAAASLGRLASRGELTRLDKLCETTQEGRSYVRANALAALAVAKKRCGDGGHERAAVLSDPSPQVRARAAALVAAVASDAVEADRRALRRCVLDDRSGMVVAACRGAEGVGRGVERHEPLVVFIVPDGMTLPQSRAPFALVLPDGLMRMGLADRRGGVFEARVARGMVELAVPAALAR